MANNNSNVNYKANKKHWLGSTQHMMGNSNMFVPINNNVGDHERVTFGDNLKGR